MPCQPLQEPSASHIAQPAVSSLARLNIMLRHKNMSRQAIGGFICLAEQSFCACEGESADAGMIHA